MVNVYLTRAWNSHGHGAGLHSMNVVIETNASLWTWSVSDGVPDCLDVSGAYRGVAYLKRRPCR